jgi:hypothetical protein
LEAEGVLQFPDDIAHQEKPIVLLSSMRAAWKQLNWPPADLPLSCYRYSSRSSTQKGADSHGDRTEFSPSASLASLRRISRESESVRTTQCRTGALDARCVENSLLVLEN